MDGNAYRKAMGSVLRQYRTRDLRAISRRAHVSLSYLSEVERGEKNVSPELLVGLCQVLDLPLPVLLRQVADRLEETHA